MSTLPLGRSVDGAPLQDVVLVLTEKIGSGNDREVWRHPLNRALGVKVAKPEQERAQNDIDLHYSAHLERLGVAGPHVPRVHGWVRTNRGRGLVVDLVQRADGTPCPTLSQAVRSGTITEMEAVGLIYEACEWLTRNGVILADYGLDNFLIRQSSVAGRAYLVFVDGLGTRHFDFKYWARCTFTPLEQWTARQKALAFRDKTLAMLRDRSSRLWVPKKQQHLAA
ncbi:YrbL family protein [Bordetella sp. H567]|uniref:YrbL family protein n=1 Tax=Bordetella sp. H567 TaxID=1697043 RepID=UPI0011AB4C6E|nr:YrbL family protein [Bordetella sp. H567]